MENEMKILVTVKRVTDFEANLKIKPDLSGIETNGVNMIMNPFDEIAVEEALRIKEKFNCEVVVVSVGPESATQQIRSALAMGADRGILISTVESLDCFTISYLLKKVVENENPQIILMGKQAIDDDSHQVSEMLAERLGYPQATQANLIEIKNNKANVVREIDGGLETIEVDLPCVITADLRLNEPRYPSLPGIMKARKKPLNNIKASEFDVNFLPKLKILSLEFPKKRSTGEIVPDIETLILKLKNEAKVI